MKHRTRERVEREEGRGGGERYKHLQDGNAYPNDLLFLVGMVFSFHFDTNCLVDIALDQCN